MASKLLAEVGRAAGSMAVAVRHLAWYLSYHLDLGGTARIDETRDRRRRAASGRRKR
jgi:hypothetical protein